MNTAQIVHATSGVAAAWAGAPLMTQVAVGEVQIALAELARERILVIDGPSAGLGVAESLRRYWTDRFVALTSRPRVVLACAEWSRVWRWWVVEVELDDGTRHGAEVYDIEQFDEQGARLALDLVAGELGDVGPWTEITVRDPGEPVSVPE